jgi:hypothetical protein
VFGSWKIAVVLEVGTTVIYTVVTPQLSTIPELFIVSENRLTLFNRQAYYLSAGIAEAPVASAHRVPITGKA